MSIYVKLSNPVAAELDRQRAEFAAAEMTREEFIKWLLEVRKGALELNKKKDKGEDIS